jgi:hypothetical protein
LASPGLSPVLALEIGSLWRQTFRGSRAHRPDSSAFKKAFGDYVNRFHVVHPYSAQRLLQQLKTQGYAGGYSILKEFVRLVRKPAFLMAVML